MTLQLLHIDTERLKSKQRRNRESFYQCVINIQEFF